MTNEDPLDYDPRHWHNIQPPEEIDVSRHFEYDEDATSSLRKWLRLDEAVSKTIAEVGCGSGYFTEKLIQMTTTLREMVAIEPDNVLREHAKQKQMPKVRFAEGSAEELPLPDGFADLTVCHIVLNILPDVYRAVSEMARVTKSGGVVAAIEPGGGWISYYPDPGLNELEEAVRKPYGRGIWDLRCELMDYSKKPEQKIQRARYPEIFRSVGLIDVEAHGILSVFLLSDPRRNRREITSWLEKRLQIHENSRERVGTILRRGGLSESLIDEYYQAKKAYLSSLVKYPEQIPETHELQTTCRIVTIGFKP